VVSKQSFCDNLNDHFVSNIISVSPSVTASGGRDRPTQTLETCWCSRTCKLMRGEKGDDDNDGGRHKYIYTTVQKFGVT